jgi:hypothetical protein
MPLHLLSLPLEIQYQIYSYLLVSPSKHVTTLPPGPWIFSILPWDMRQEITLESHTGARSLDLSLLRVSKQLNRECKELLWGRNTFVYRPFEVYRHTDSALEKGLGPLAGARHIAMHVDMTIGNLDIEAVAGALEALGSWAKSGSLEEVIIIVVNERCKPFQERDPVVETKMAYKASLEKVIRFRTGNSFENPGGVHAPEQAKECFQGYLSVFRDARDGCLADLKRKMIVNTNFGKLSSQGQHKYLRDAFMDPNELMMELNEAFGGELWVDGRLCFTDGKEIREAFQACLIHDSPAALEIERADLVVTTQDKGVSRTPKVIEIPSRGTTGRTPWGELLQVQASVLDVVE